MALTVLTAISRVMSRIEEGGGPAVLAPDVEPLIPDALKKFAQLVAAAPDIRQLLRKDFTITVSAGSGTLSGLTAAEPMLAEFLPSAHLVISGSTTPMQYLPDRAQLSLTRPIGFFIYWINDEGILRTRNTDGSLTSLTATVTVTAQYVPLITSVPSQLEEMFIDTLEMMIKERPVKTGEANE